MGMHLVGAYNGYVLVGIYNGYVYSRGMMGVCICYKIGM